MDKCAVYEEKSKGEKGQKNKSMKHSVDHGLF